MPANVDSMMSVREVPWHGEGVVLKKRPKSIQEALVASGLDWEVKQLPVKVTFEGSTRIVANEDGDPRFLANTRSDNGHVLGIVTDRYTPVQNVEAFEFLANVFGSEMHFETAGALMDGRRVWVMMALPDYVEVGGDPIGQYAFISNSHDGKSSVLASMTPIRIVCQNTLGAAISRAKGLDAQRTYTIRHLGNMSQKIAEARNVLEVTINYYEQFKTMGDKLALVKFGDKKALNVLSKVFPIGDEIGDRAARNQEEARQAVMTLFKEGTTKDGVSTVGNAPGSAWALYNASIEYADWHRESRKSRWQRAVDDPDGLKNAAFIHTLAAAGMN